MHLPWDLLHMTSLIFFFFLCFLRPRLTCSLLNDRLAGPVHYTINSKSQEVS